MKGKGTEGRDGRKEQASMKIASDENVILSFFLATEQSYEF